MNNKKMPHITSWISWIILFSLLSGEKLIAQEPWAYWRFENESSENLINGVKANIRPHMFKSVSQDQSVPPDPSIKASSNRGKGFLSFTPENAETLKLVKREFGQGITIEFFFRFDRSQALKSCRLFYTQNYSFYTTIGPGGIGFNTIVKSPDGQKIVQSFAVPLDGSGRRSLGYYLDNNWHQMVFKFDALSGKKEIWVDGKLADGFSTVHETKGEAICASANCTSQLVFNHQSNSRSRFIGDLDEVVIYDEFIDEDIHIQHLFQFWENEPFQFKFLRNLYGGKVLNIKEINASKRKNSSKALTYDPLEYPQGLIQSSIEPIDQLQNYPIPRYKKGHNLLRLFSWVNNEFLAGRFRRDITNSQATLNSYQLQKELALNWHYSLSLGASTLARSTDMVDNPNNFIYHWIKLANELPEVPCNIVTLWPQTFLKDIGEDNAKPYVSRQDLPDDYYLRNNEGEFMNWNGGKFKGNKFISPSASGKLFKIDGEVQNLYLDILTSRLTRPLDWVNENGEVLPYPFKASILDLDSEAVKEKAKGKFEDWDTYQAYKKTTFRKYYRDQMLRNIKSKQTIFTWYGIDGGDTPSNRFKWSEAKKILTPIRGRYLSTTDFYPREPKWWKTGAGPWHGWNWMEKTRKVEIMDGDHLCSPFIGAGWEKDPEKNIRPSQWLGLLKNLTVLGSEFFYVGFFNENVWENYPDPRNYVWQLAIPSYAQAISSYFEEILIEGKLLEDENGEPITRHWVGDPRVVVVVRKHLTDNCYVIAASINPSSNIPDNVEEKKIVFLELEGEEVAIEVRKQGSVYILDKTTSGKPVFWQLDKWHEAGHPYNWSTIISYEAEMFDESDRIERLTYKPNIGQDFRDFKTYVSSTSSNAEVVYHISTRGFSSGTALLNFQAGISGRGSGAISVFVNGREVREFVLESESRTYDEEVYPFTQALSCVLTDLEGEEFKLSFKCKTSGTLLDNFILSSVQNTYK